MRTGFGSIMIQRALEAQLDGEVTIDYDPVGVVCLVEAPIESLRDTGDTEKDGQ
jgi:hypothetical protein